MNCSNPCETTCTSWKFVAISLFVFYSKRIGELCVFIQFDGLKLEWVILNCVMQRMWCTCPLIWQYSKNTHHFSIYSIRWMRERKKIRYCKMSRHKNEKLTKTTFRKVSVVHLYMCVWWDLIQNCLCGHRSFFALSFAFHSTLPNIDKCLCNEAHTKNRLKISKHFE